MGGTLCGRKTFTFIAQSNKKSVNLGTLPVFDFCHQTPCEKHSYLFPDLFCFFPLETWKKIYGKIERWRSCMDMWRIEKRKMKNINGKMMSLTEKWKKLYGKNLEKWRIGMETWRNYQDKCRNSMEKNDDFVWKSERIDMVQRYSEYRFFDVNCILSIVFQVQFRGCPGKPKFQFHILCRWRTLHIYIYIRVYIIYSIIVTYIHTICTESVRQFLGVGPKSHSQLWDPRLERFKLSGWMA